MSRYNLVLSKLQAIGQEHLLNFHHSLDEASRSRLLDQIDSLDLASIPRLVNDFVKNKPAFELPPDIEPAPYFPANPTTPGRQWNAIAARTAGERLLREGRVAAFTVAGGQGSRLGFEGPKGCFPASPVNKKTLFEIFAEGLLAAERKHGKPVPWYIMTSPLNHQATIAFFEERKYLGLHQSNVVFFPQGVLPSMDIANGRVLLAAKGEVATNPDGHGGSIRALYVSGSLDDMRRRGVTQISYFQVDNPMVKVVDPVFLGLHAAGDGSSGEMSSKMIPKLYPEEKVGLFCKARGRVQVIEYSDLPMELQRQKTPDGSLRFLAGSIAVHAMSVEFVSRVASDPAFDLPYHRAEKKIPCIDPSTGAPINPASNNGVKLERFVFDALPLCRSSIVFETDRLEEFAPIKNATGVDSVESSAKLQSQRAARWLERAGVAVPKTASDEPDCVVELSPLTALEPGDLAGKVGAGLPRAIERGARLAL